MSTRVSRFLTLGFVFSIALVLIFAPSSHAVDFVVPVTGYTQPMFFSQIYFCTDASLPNISYEVNPGAFCKGSNTKRWARTGVARIEAGGNTSNWAVAGIRIANTGNTTIPEGSYISIPFYISSNAQALNFVTQVGLIPLPNSNTVSLVDVVGIEFDEYDSGGYRMTLILKAISDLKNAYLEFSTDATDVYTATGSNPFNNNFWWSRGIGTAGIVAGIGVIYHPTDPSEGVYDDTNVLNYLYNINQKLDTISQNSAAATAEEILQAVQETDQNAQDRYEDEKNTISDNGTDAQNSASSMSFSGFSVGNPLLNWIALFTDNTCVSIPTIASWIHSNETQVCSPWSSSVRSVTTPIIGVLGGTILFGFLVNWLKQKDGQELS